MQTNKIAEVVERETALLEHIMNEYSFLFEMKNKLGNGEIQYPGEDFKNKVIAVMNRLNTAIGVQRWWMA